MSILGVLFGKKRRTVITSTNIGPDGCEIANWVVGENISETDAKHLLQYSDGNDAYLIHVYRQGLRRNYVVTKENFDAFSEKIESTNNDFKAARTQLWQWGEGPKV